MEENAVAATLHAACSHHKRAAPDTAVAEAIIQSIAADYTVLPLFERKIRAYIRARHCSLRRNHLLSCRWRRYTEGFATRTRSPVQFPKIGDFHFYIYHTRYAPSQSISKTSRHRLKMAAGPGVDEFGDIPIPSDMHLRKFAFPQRSRPS